jgi:hypothetical protein
MEPGISFSASKSKLERKSNRTESGNGSGNVAKKVKSEIKITALAAFRTYCPGGNSGKNEREKGKNIANITKILIFAGIDLGYV